MRYPDEFCAIQLKRKTISEEGYSYSQFDRMKCIFVHIPKCAGVSMCKSLFGNLGGGHQTASHYRLAFDYDEYSNYFKFTVVRNPWDRLVSAFKFLKAGGFNSQDRLWAEKNLAQFHDFESFVLGWVSKENIWNYYHFRPQYHYICDCRGRLDVDFVAYFETLGEDFKGIVDRLGVSASLEFLNKGASEGANYTDYYNEITKEIVRDVYSRDVELLEYDFNNSLLPPKLNKER